MTTYDLPILSEPDTAEASEGTLGRLETEQGYLPLIGLDVAADITGLTVGTRVTQVFRNATDGPLEATYIFALPDRAAVTSFTARMGDRLVEGVLKERGQARQEYDEALAAGYRAAITEQERSDVFTVRVGNIAPGERAEIELALAGPLALDGHEATFRFPLVVAPRYIPGAALPQDPVGDGIAPDTDAVPDASRISPPVLLPGQRSPVRLSVTCRIDAAGLPVGQLRSSLHAVATEVDGGAHVVRLQPGERLDRDFILRFAVGGQDVEASAGISADSAGSDGTLTVTIVPPAPDPDAPAAPRDVVIALDRSGSMSGWKMVAARRAAARIVDSLTPDDRFALVAFDHEIDVPHDALRSASDRNRFAAVEYLSRLDARGGTELLQALSAAASLLEPGEGEERRRVLVLVTDGQVGDEDRLVARLSTELAGVDAHVVGIDRAISAGLLGRLSALGSGAGYAELVESEDRLDEALARVRQRIAAPVLTGIRLAVAGAVLDEATLVPAGPISCTAGVPLVLRARLQEIGADPVRVAVAATSADGQPWTCSLDAGRSTDTAPTAVWAREHLRHLEDRWLVGSASQKELVAESLRFGVLCRFTAFVAVDRSESVGDGRPLSVIQPVEAPSGWDLPQGPPLRSALFADAAPMRFASRAMAPMVDAADFAMDELNLAGSVPSEPDRVSRALAEIERAMPVRSAAKLRRFAAELRALADELELELSGEAVERLCAALHELAEALDEAAQRTLTRGMSGRITTQLQRARKALRAVQRIEGFGDLF